MRDPIVIVNGTFDVLHSGHLKLLDHASSLGGFLFICIDNDKRVTELKGLGRPVNNLEFRMRVLQALYPKASVTSFGTSDLLYARILSAKEAARLFETSLVMVKGDDYKDKKIIGSDLVDRIIYVERDNQSSTNSINR